MEPFKAHTGIVFPLDRVNVDTDAIIPKQFLRKIDRVGFGKHLFHEWRYLDYEGTKENPEFTLNQERYQGASVLLARDNFGCGSSREHAPWALADYGIQVIIAPSFADIFYNNCFKNGILPIVLNPRQVDELFNDVIKTPGFQVTADLNTQIVESSPGRKYSFDIDTFGKEFLLKGLDSIGWTEQFTDKIKEFEGKDQIARPWVYSK